MWNVVEGETMEIPGGDKVPPGDNRSATHRKLYLRQNLVLFNASSLLDLYTHILERLSSSSSALRKDLGPGLRDMDANLVHW